MGIDETGGKLEDIQFESELSVRPAARTANASGTHNSATFAIVAWRRFLEKFGIFCCCPH